MTPKQLENFIAEVRTRNLRISWGVEVFEAMAADAPESIRGQMIADAKDLMKRCRKYRKRTNKALESLQEILKEDQLLNSWKGENRYIEL